MSQSEKSRTEDRPRESQIVKNIFEALKKIPNLKAVKLHGNRYQERGTPDLLIVYEGEVYLQEVKVPGNKPTPIQRKRMQQWTDAGAHVSVVHSVRESLGELMVNVKL